MGLMDLKPRTDNKTVGYTAGQLRAEHSDTLVKKNQMNLLIGISYLLYFIQ